MSVIEELKEYLKVKVGIHQNKKVPVNFVSENWAEITEAHYANKIYSKVIKIIEELEAREGKG